MKFMSMVKSGKKRNGRHFAILEKTCKYGDVISRETIDRNKRVIIFTGPHNSGKTRYMTRLRDEASAFWFQYFCPVPYDTYMKWGKTKDEILGKRDLTTMSRDEIMEKWKFPSPVFINARGAKAEWFHDISKWWKERNPKGKWTQLTSAEKDHALLEYIEKMQAMVFIDDIHVLSDTANKTRLVKEMITVAQKVVITCSEETQICQSLRPLLVRSEFSQILRLTSEDAVADITQPFIWILLTVLLAAAGQLGLSFLVAGMGVLKSRGQSRAAR